MQLVSNYMLYYNLPLKCVHFQAFTSRMTDVHPQAPEHCMVKAAIAECLCIKMQSLHVKLYLGGYMQVEYILQCNMSVTVNFYTSVKRP